MANVQRSFVQVTFVLLVIVSLNRDGFSQTNITVYNTTGFASAGKNQTVALQDQSNKSVQSESVRPEETPPQFVGEFFGIQVPLQNYQFVKNVSTVFGFRDAQPKTDQDKENYYWDQLLYSFEAFRRNIVISQEELDNEIVKLLAAEKVSFDFKKDPAAFSKWLQERTNVTPEIFNNMIRHLLQVQKLRQQVLDSLNPVVDEKDAHQKFVNQYNTLGVELVEFATQKEADEFYRKAKADKNFWGMEKEKRAKDFKRPGFVSCEFLIDIWKFPQDATLKMVRMKPGEYYKPEPIYKGFAVFKVLEGKPAQEAEFQKNKKSFFDQVKMRKKFEGLGSWFEDLKKQAHITVYKTGGEK
ncbi:MAG TPA: hypothetical protein PKL77_03995 [Candidatus Omnitrophota bacterium]|nr:hypothetical protein [Candidatus Omnitrophota bacterium]HPT07799.1 hypothetical protein [Candidatus Omnitrophota bacterium]